MSRNKKRKRYWAKKLPAMDPEKTTENNAEEIKSEGQTTTEIAAAEINAETELAAFDVNENGNIDAKPIEPKKPDPTPIEKTEIQSEEMNDSQNNTEETTQQETEINSTEAENKNSDEDAIETKAEVVHEPIRMGFDPVTIVLILVVVGLIIYIIYRVSKRNV